MSKKEETVVGKAVGIGNQGDYFRTASSMQYATTVAEIKRNLEKAETALATARALMERIT